MPFKSRLKRSEYFKKYREKHYFYLIEKSREWKRNNKDKIKKQPSRNYKGGVYNKNYYLNYKERKKINDKKWYSSIKVKEYRNYLNQLRRIKLKKIKGHFTLEEWQNLKRENNYKCKLCGKSEPEITLSIDHILPVSKSGSTNFISNIQPLCRSCNSSKGNRILQVT